MSLSRRNSHVRRTGLEVVLLITTSLVVLSCGGDGGGNPCPDSGCFNVTGIWGGTFTDDNGTGTLSFELQQSGAQVTGSFIARPQGSVPLSGSVQGDVSGDQWSADLRLSVTGCNVVFETQGTVTSSTIRGTFVSGNDCGLPVSDGQFSVNKGVVVDSDADVAGDWVYTALLSGGGLICLIDPTSINLTQNSRTLGGTHSDLVVGCVDNNSSGTPLKTVGTGPIVDGTVSQQSVSFDFGSADWHNTGIVIEGLDGNMVLSGTTSARIDFGAPWGQVALSGSWDAVGASGPGYVARIEMSPSTVAVSVGGNAQLNAIAFDQAGDQVTDAPINWLSGNPSTASVSGSGLVRGVAVGSTVITARSGAASASATVNVVTDGRTLLVALIGNGSVTSSPGGISCAPASPSACSALFDVGATVTLTAAPAVGWSFSGWGGACSGTGSCAVTMSVNQTVTAQFEQVTLRRLSITGSGPGAGVVRSQAGLSPSINCTLEAGTGLGACGADYAGGTAVTLTAAPTSGSSFAGWSGACTGTGSCALTMSDNYTVTATFATVPQLPDLTITATVGETYSSEQANVPIPVTVSRAGGKLALGTHVTARLYWSTNSSWEPSTDTQLWESNGSTPDFPNPTLNTSGSATVTASITIPAAAAGTYNILAIVDPENFFPEGNESNNVAGYRVTLAAPPVSVASVTVMPESAALPVGGTVQLTATARDAEGNVLVGRTATWTTSDPLLAVVSETGLVTGVATGNATITATIEGKSDGAAITVEVRAIQDRPDDVSGSQVHVMYVLPSDLDDRRLDVDGVLANSVGSFQTWLASRTAGRRLRIDTYQGEVDVTFFRLGRSDAVMQSYREFVRDEIERELAEAGLLRPGKLYAVYYDGGSVWSCGAGAWPPDLPGQVAAMYLRGTPPDAPACSTNDLASSPTAAPGYFEFGMLHEILHTLGFVADNAPHEHARGHVPEPTDLMYAGVEPWQPATLDVGQDDYYGNNVPPEVLNFTNSPFLLPSAAGQQRASNWGAASPFAITTNTCTPTPTMATVEERTVGR